MLKRGAQMGDKTFHEPHRIAGGQHFASSEDGVGLGVRPEHSAEEPHRDGEVGRAEEPHRRK